MTTTADKPAARGESKQIPAAACQLQVGAFAFAASDVKGEAPVTLMARSTQPVEHWYWGRVIHDLDGMNHKPSVPIDYCHNAGEVIGYLDTFTRSAAGLQTSGKLVAFGDNDRAAEVIHKGRAGVPYEASIYFNGEGVVIEQVPEAYQTQVNGFTVEGPIAVIRQWPLRGVAITPYGQDKNTSTQFAAGAGDVAVTMLTSDSHEDAMSDKTNTAKPATDKSNKTAPDDATQMSQAKPGEQSQKPVEPKPAEQPQAPAVTPPADAAKFMATFGEAQGAVYFAKGYEFTQALAEHVKKQTDQIADLTTRLQQADRGETSPAAFQEAPDDSKGDDELEKLTHAFGGDAAARERAVRVIEKRRQRAAK